MKVIGLIIKLILKAGLYIQMEISNKFTKLKKIISFYIFI